MKSAHLKYTVLVAGIFVSSIILYSCGTSEAKTEEKKEAAPTITTVETIALEKGIMSSALQIPGELTAKQDVDLYAKVNSFVRQMTVDVGSEVKAGQLLAVLDAPEITAQLTAASSRLKSQEAVYIASKANYDRLLQTSQTPGTISPNELDQALARKNADMAILEAAKANYKEIADTKNYLEVRAPFDGTISVRNISLGAYVGPSGKGSEKPMFFLQNQRILRLAVAIPEVYTAYLSNNTEVSFSVKARPNEVFHAKVKRMAGSLDTRLRAERIEMDIDNSAKKLLPGMVAEVKITLPSKESTFIVPKSALVVAPERVFVVRVVNGKAEWVDVQKGREVDGNVEIFGDLKQGDTLVKVASEEVRNGFPVNIAK
ncbi:efflux RND transporter periplasmic adaptor subunit [Flectobacillus major]|uniref:efflux RND transporter periplasmic adaptor subunit n=1 Tax=Flectobacillus major TaxID=103 RepID=UPI0003FDF4C8|nr:efflux RND transporter periplasmic adaptor subunit [Flectobacillus major]